MTAVRVLFLGHGAERTGPPVLLLRLARWLRAHEVVEPSFVLLEGGPLLGDFQALGPTWVAGDRPRLREVPAPDLVYVNTAGSIRALPLVPAAADVPVLAHVHELSAGLDHFLAAADRRRLLAEASRYLAVSEAVRRHLVEDLGVDATTVSLHPGFVAHAPAAAGPVAGPPPGPPVVGACGTTGWRKAPDLFLAVAAAVERTRPDLGVHYVWVGGPSGEGDALDRVVGGVRALGLGDRFHRPGQVDDPMPWLRRFDVFALTSREDAFPLVGVEAASAGVPLVCFDKGGMPELVTAARCGVVVPYPDVEQFAAELVVLLDDPDDRVRQGRRGADHVAAHLVTEVRAPAVLAEIEAAAR